MSLNRRHRPWTTIAKGCESSRVSASLEMHRVAGRSARDPGQSRVTRGF